MGTEWETASLTDLYEVSSGLSKPASEFGSGHPFLGFKDVFYNYFVPDQLSDLVQSNQKEQEKCSVKRGDVFLTRTSETMHELGMSCVALKDYENATFNGFTKRLRPKSSNELVPEYVGYYLRSKKFRNEMLAFSTMSTRASLNNGMISQLCISYPDVETQREIAWILKALDDKIELNRQMNATLEAMAQSLFKSWFVDFDPVIDNALAAGNPIPEPLQPRADARAALGDQRKPLPEAIQKQFPNRFVFNEDMGWVPEGWEIRTIEEIASAVGMGPFGSNIKVETFVDEGIPIVNGQHLNNTLLTEGTHNFITEEHATRLHKSLVNAGDLVFTHRGTIGQVSLVPASSRYKKFVVSQSQMFLRPDKQKVTSSYLIYFFRSHVGQHRLLANTSQVGVPSIARPSSHLKSIRLVLPDGDSLNEFDRFCASWLTTIQGHRTQTETLTGIRDALLPKLLSGQLRIPGIEKQTYEAKCSSL